MAFFFFAWGKYLTLTLKFLNIRVDQYSSIPKQVPVAQRPMHSDAFIKPFEAPQRSVKIKIPLNFLSSSGIGMGKFNIRILNLSIFSDAINSTIVI